MDDIEIAGDRGQSRRILGAFNGACLVSLSGAAAAIATIALASAGRMELALVCLMLAGLADLFDGVVARRLALNEYEREYGTQLDTVIDAIAFVAAPVIIGLHAGLNSLPGLFALGAFALAGIVRLAHFNTLSARGVDQSTHHRGLPVTYVALFMPFVFIVRDFAPPTGFRVLLGASFVLMGAAFVLNVRIRKPHGRYYVLLPVLAVALILFWTRRHFALS